MCTLLELTFMESRIIYILRPTSYHVVVLTEYNTPCNAEYSKDMNNRQYAL